MLSIKLDEGQASSDDIELSDADDAIIDVQSTGEDMELSIALDELKRRCETLF